MKQHIPTTAASLPFTPISLGDESKVVFYAKPITQADYDQLGYELFRHNIVPISTSDFRAIMIEEIFKIHGDEVGEEKAQLVDEYWQGEDLYGDLVNDWKLQEQQRLFDEQHGAPRRQPAPPPQHPTGVRRRAQAEIFMQDMRRASALLRDKTIEMQTYEPKQRDGMVRLVLTGWEGLSTPFAKPHDIVPDDLFDAVKLEIGKVAINELHMFVASIGNVSKEDMGNSDSLLENEQDLNGSQALNDASASSDGSLTSQDRPTAQTSNSELIPVSESEEIIEPSSTSTTDVAGESPSIA